MDEDELSRNQTLADFQACTGIEDIQHALAVLNEANWDLQFAVNNALNQSEDTSYVPEPEPNISVVGRGFDVHSGFESLTQPNGAHRAIVNDEVPSALRHPLIGSQREIIDEHGVSRRLLNFVIHFEEDVHPLTVADSATVFELMERLESLVKRSRNDFSVVWEDNRIEPEESMTLRQLHLPRENTLHLLSCEAPQLLMDTDEPGPSTSGPATEAMISDFDHEFRLRVEVGDDPLVAEIVTQDFAGTTTVHEVKESFASRCSIPLTQQRWTGWPPHVSGDHTLAACGLLKPIHTLHLIEGTLSQPSVSHNVISMSDSCDSDDDYLADDIEQIFQPKENPNRTPLIPPDCTDPTAALEHFNTVFSKRYPNTSHPVFYVGSLLEAIREALDVPVAERRLLAIYLHHDDSVKSNVFCDNVLCSDLVSNYLTANFLCWAWDLTHPQNKNRLIQQCVSSQLASAGEQIRRLNSRDLPLLLLVQKVRGSLEILGTQHATVGTEELMTSLLTFEQVFQEQKSTEVKEEVERNSREEIVRLQDAAYEESLAVDRVKEAERKAQENAAMQEQVRVQEERLKQEELQTTLADSLPDEPELDCQLPMAVIRFRCPDGSMFNRRFLAMEPFRHLLNYLTSKGFSQSDYKILTTFPRKDLSDEDGWKSLEEMKLCPQETLILESKS